MSKVGINVSYTDEDDITISITGSREDIKEVCSWSDLLEFLDPLEDSPMARLDLSSQETEKLTIAKVDP